MTLARIHSDSLNNTLTRLLNGSECDALYTSQWTPLVDVIEKEDAYEVIAEIPGMNKEEIHLAVEDNVLTLSGEKQARPGENVTCHRQERSSGKFERTFRLPKEVKSSDIKARYENGILIVTLPKAEEVKPKQISIH